MNIQSTAPAHDIYVMNLGFHILDPEYRFPTDWYYNNVLHLWDWAPVNCSANQITTRSTDAAA